MLSSNVDKANPYALDTTNSPQNSKGLIRLGASTVWLTVTYKSVVWMALQIKQH